MGQFWRNRGSHTSGSVFCRRIRRSCLGLFRWWEVWWWVPPTRCRVWGRRGSRRTCWTKTWPFQSAQPNGFATQQPHQSSWSVKKEGWRKSTFKIRFFSDFLYGGQRIVILPENKNCLIFSLMFYENYWVFAQSWQILMDFCLPPEGQEELNLVILLGIISFVFHWSCLQTSNKTHKRFY